MAMPSQTRAAAEAVGEMERRSISRCVPFTRATPASFVSTSWTYPELLRITHQDALVHVARQDLGEEDGTDVPNCFSLLKRELWTIVRKCFGDNTWDSLSHVFDPAFYIDHMGVARKSQLRAIKEERSNWADLLIRAHTSYHNGVKTSEPLGSGDIMNGGSIAIDSNTRFQKAARNYSIPDEQQILSKMADPDKSKSTHPYLAAARYLTVTSLRALATSVGAAQEDPNLSSNRRDAGAYGKRPVHQLKDLGHSGVPSAPLVGAKTVRTLIDCLSYETSLREHSGHDMIIWASYYPELAGQTCESVYYADSDNSFVEIVGKDKATAIYKRQIAWDFTPSDIVYVENEDRSAFTVYNVIRYPQPNLLKQVVFLCALQTVNLPYAIVDRLVRWTKGHNLASVGIGTPRPCTNVVLVPKDPARPYTQDILVMSNGTPGRPTASIKYKNATSPHSCTTMSTELYDFLKSVNTQAGRHLTVREVIKRLELYALNKEDICEPSAAAYCELLRTVAWWGDLPNVVYYGSKAPKSTLSPDEIAEAKAVLAAPQLTLNNPGVTVKTDGAMETYVEEKMVGRRNTTVPTKQWQKISNLILKHWVDCIQEETGIQPGSIQLVDREQILKARSKRMQRDREVTFGLGPEGPEIGRAELKNEVAHKAKCPRCITCPAYDVSIESGVLGKTLELVLKKTEWYNPGLTPTQLAETVADCYEMSCKHESISDCGGVRAVDYTAADEGHTKHSNRVNRALIERFLCERDLARALEIYDSCFDMPVQVGPKVESTRDKNASGTGITTIQNTGPFSERELETTVLAMVFRSMMEEGKPRNVVDSLEAGEAPDEVMYKDFIFHLRHIQENWNMGEFHHDGKKQIIAIAYGWIGPKFGDDGLAPATPFVSDKLWECAMHYVDRMDGFERKLVTTSAVKGEPVEYLSRIYPCPTSSQSSYCKVEKAIDKISIAINRDRERYFLKLRGYWTTDRNTPIVGAYLEAIAGMYGITLSEIGNGTAIVSEEQLSGLDPSDELRKVYESDRDLYYKVAGGPYPYDANDSELQYECVALDYGMTANELYEFDQKLRQQSTWTGIQGMTVPASIDRERPEDPLGEQRTPDPLRTERVAAFNSGDDPRLANFESNEGGSETAGVDSARLDAARRAFGNA
uniref:RNA replicase n=1 Tax=Beihai noda-like virus 21 TaxID=1922475 RepID=A0A1L3KFL1_9VIRU|nr:hypothetical protein [Beihai noda-like virus 21]